MQPERQCKAHRKNGNRCQRAAILGGVVCIMHGGMAPQVRLAAQERLQSFVDPALDELQKLLRNADSDSVKLAAIKDVLDRTGHKLPDKIEQTGEQTIRVEYAEHPSQTNGKVSWPP